MPPERPRPNHGWRPLAAIVGVLVLLAAVAIGLTVRQSSEEAAGDCQEASGRQQLELSAEGHATDADLQRTAEILRKRMRLYDCDAKVSADGQRLQVSAASAAVSHLPELTARGDLQFREVLDAQPGSHCPKPTGPVPAEAQLVACSKDGLEQFTLAPAALTGADVKGTTAQKDRQLGEWQVFISFTDKGQARFTQLTSDIVAKRMAILLDGVVLTAPTIQERIDGDAQVTGSFTEGSAKALANALSYGALPVTLHRA